MRRIATSLLASLLTLTAPALLAAVGADSVIQEKPALRITEIHFAGNEITQPSVMLRELPFRKGDWADQAVIERGRQAILDLGLFKSVSVAQAPEGEGLALTYTVKEKWFLLPLPRVDANGDGQYAYGAQLRWNNLFGLNHTLRLTALQREAKRQGVGKETAFSFGYSAPFVWDSRWSLGFGGGASTRPLSTPQGAYQESFQSLQALASRSLSEQPRSQGWTAGGGLLYQRQNSSGVVASYGEATAPVLLANYRDLRFHVYSETGLLFGSRLEFANKGLASDYDYARLNLGLKRYWPFGSTPYQTLHLIGELGMNWAGPPGSKAFSLGGSSALRGYEKDFREGDAYYRAAVEFARPIFWPWLRLVVIGEVGNVLVAPNEIGSGGVYSSLGLGLRLRLPAFVDLEVEAGAALPLSGGSLRAFAGRV